MGQHSRTNEPKCSWRGGGSGDRRKGDWEGRTEEGMERKSLHVRNVVGGWREKEKRREEEGERIE